MAAPFQGGPPRVDSDESDTGGGARLLSSPALTRAGSTTSASSMNSTGGGKPAKTTTSSSKLNPGSAPFMPPSAKSHSTFTRESGAGSQTNGNKGFGTQSATEFIMQKIKEEFGGSDKKNSDQGHGGLARSHSSAHISVASPPVASPQPQRPIHVSHWHDNKVNLSNSSAPFDNKTPGNSTPAIANENLVNHGHQQQGQAAVLSPTANAFQPQLQKIDDAYQDMAQNTPNQATGSMPSIHDPSPTGHYGAYTVDQNAYSPMPAPPSLALPAQQPNYYGMLHSDGVSSHGQAQQTQQMAVYNNQLSSSELPTPPYTGGFQGDATTSGYRGQAPQPSAPPQAFNSTAQAQAGYAVRPGYLGQGGPLGVVASPANSPYNDPYNGQPLYINKRSTPIPLDTPLAAPMPTSTVQNTTGVMPIPSLEAPYATKVHTPSGEKPEYNHFVYKPLPATIEPLYLDNPNEKKSLFEPPSEHVRAQRSALLNQLVPESGKPELSELMNPKFFPFMEPAMAAKPVEHGVIHLKNIPFTTTRAEIIALVGRNSRLLNDHEEPVHIIMDRTTSKTNDAYVELLTMQDAIIAIKRCKKGDRSTRLGDRLVDIELGSQAQLMKALFPFAPGVVWHGAQPHIKPDQPDMPWENFKRFVTSEEMTMLVKHVEIPHRSPFSRTCPERAYDCMISTIKKLPWYMTEYITIKQRYQVFDACSKLMDLLLNNLRQQRNPDRLTPQLMKRFTNAIMLCPGFTVCQKDNIACLVLMNETDMRKFNMPRFAEGWVHQYTLGPKPGIPMDVLEYYIALIRGETTRCVEAMPSRDRQQFLDKNKATNTYWGYFWREVAFPVGPEFDNMTLAAAAMLEWSAVDRILRRALQVANGVNIPSIPGMGNTSGDAYVHGIAQGPLNQPDN